MPFCSAADPAGKGLCTRPHCPRPPASPSKPCMRSAVAAQLAKDLKAKLPSSFIVAVGGASLTHLHAARAAVRSYAATQWASPLSVLPAQCPRPAALVSCNHRLPACQEHQRIPSALCAVRARPLQASCAEGPCVLTRLPSCPDLPQVLSSKYDIKTKVVTVQISVNSATARAIMVNSVVLAIQSKPADYFGSGGYASVWRGHRLAWTLGTQWHLLRPRVLAWSWQRPPCLDTQPCSLRPARSLHLQQQVGHRHQQGHRHADRPQDCGRRQGRPGL